MKENTWCNQCGICCYFFDVEVTREELDKILKILDSNLKQSLLSQIKQLDENYYWWKNPCPLLLKKGDKFYCRVHEVKPKVCKELNKEKCIKLKEKKKEIPLIEDERVFNDPLGTLDPNAEATPQDWGTYGSGTGHYDRLADGDDSTGIQTVTEDLDDCINIDNMAETPTTIDWVQIFCRARSYNGEKGGERIQLIDKFGASERVTGNITVLRTDFQEESSNQYTTQPDGITAWTEEAVNGLTIGVRSITVGSGETLAVSEMWAVVNYSTAGVTYKETLPVSLIIQDSLSLEADKSLEETPSFNDQISTVSSYLRTLLESFSIIDSFSRAFSIFRTWTETLQIQDQLTKVKSFLRTFFESLTLNDQVSKIKSLFRFLYETISFLGSLEAKLKVIQELFESLSLIDQINIVKAFFRNLNEVLVFSIKFLKRAKKTLTEEIQFSKIFSRIASYLRTYSESFLLTDQMISLVNLLKTEIVSLSDSIAVQLALITKELFETFGLTDQVSSIFSYFRTFLETLQIIDKIKKKFNKISKETLLFQDLFSKTKAVFQTFYETLALQDQLKSLFVSLRTELLSLNDSVEAALGIISQYCYESLSLSPWIKIWGRFPWSIKFTDKVTLKKFRLKLLQEALSFLDAVQAQLAVLLKELFETLNLSDQISIIASYLRTFPEALQLTDKFKKIPKITKFEILNLVDKVITIVFLLRNLFETLTLVGIVKKRFKSLRVETITFIEQIRKLPQILKTEIVSLVDSFTKVSTYVKIFLETLKFTDIISKLYRTLRQEIIILSDQVTKKASFLRTIVEILSLSDQVIRIKGIFRTFYELLELTDKLSKMTKKFLIEELQFTSLFSKIASYVRALIEELGLIDQVSSLKGYIVELFEFLQFSDKITSLSNFFRTYFETLKLQDGISKGINILKKEILTFLDSVEAVLALITKKLFEALFLVDILRKTPKILKLVTITLTDTIQIISSFTKTLIETFLLEDQIMIVKGIFRTFYESILLSVKVIKETKKALIEGLQLTDFFSRVSSYFKLLTEEITFVDIVSKVKGYILKVFETLKLSDSIITLSSFFRTFLETLTLSKFIKKRSITIKIELLNLKDTLKKRARTLRVQILTFSDFIKKRIKKPLSISLNLIGIISKRISSVRLELIQLIDSLQKTSKILKKEGLNLIDKIKAIFKFLKAVETLQLIETLKSKVSKKLIQLINFQSIVEVGYLVFTKNLYEFLLLMDSIRKKSIKFLLQPINLESIIRVGKAFISKLYETLILSDLLLKVRLVIKVKVFVQLVYYSIASGLGGKLSVSLKAGRTHVQLKLKKAFLRLLSRRRTVFDPEVFDERHFSEQAFKFGIKIKKTVRKIIKLLEK